MPNKLTIRGRNTTKIVAIDIENTRGSQKHLIEVGMVKLGISQRPEGNILTIQDHLSTLICPPVPINNTPDHGITDEDVEGAPTLLDVAERIADFLSGAHFVVSHKCSSEYLLFQKLASIGYDCHIRFLDTMEMVKVVDKCCFNKKPNSFSLSALTRKFRISPAEPHRALDDAIACANLCHGTFKTGHLGTFQKRPLLVGN
jgi:DNA polymerase III epsilon subunit-like protein